MAFYIEGTKDFSHVWITRYTFPSAFLAVKALRKLGWSVKLRRGKDKV